MYRSPLAIAALVAVAAAPVPAMANPTCWNREDVVAAKVRDLGTLVGSVGARCIAGGYMASADFDAFAEASRGALSATQQRLKARFWTVYGNVDGPQRLAGFYGAIDRTYAPVPAVAENCGQVAALAREAVASGGTIGGLLEVAERNNLTPALPGGVCKAGPMKIASR